MHNESTPKDLFDLDLVLIGLPDAEDLNLNEDMSHKLLNDCEFWYKDLKSWIQYLRQDFSLFCPEIVRKSSNLSMSLQFINDKKMTEINGNWRSIYKSTDVLSFPVIDDLLVVPRDSCLELGDIVVSAQTAFRQANELDHSFKVELRWLVSHGLLHLLGWDHLNSESLTRMLNCQSQLLAISCNLQQLNDPMSSEY